MEMVVVRRDPRGLHERICGKCNEARGGVGRPSVLQQEGAQRGGDEESFDAHPRVREQRLHERPVAGGVEVKRAVKGAAGAIEDDVVRGRGGARVSAGVFGSCEERDVGVAARLMGAVPTDDSAGARRQVTHGERLLGRSFHAYRSALEEADEFVGAPLQHPPR